MKKLIAIFVVVLLVPAMAFALSLDQAKASGAVGETPSGYLESVESNPAADVSTLITTINGKRKAQYQKIAAKRGTDLKSVEALAGKKAMEKTPPGQYVKMNGSWQKK